ncbi:MAG: hypothetical protein WCH62_06780, partial [Candidatus Omnitrophota bacterium]
MRINFIKKFAVNLLSSSKVWLYRSVFFVCLLVPIVFLGVMNYLHTNREITDSLFKQKKALAYLASSTIHERLDALVSLGISLANRPLLIEYVEKEDWSKATTLIDGFMQQFPDIDRMLLFDTDAIIKGVVPNIPEAIDQKRANREWYKQVKEHWMPCVSSVFQRGTLPRINVVSI